MDFSKLSRNQQIAVGSGALVLVSSFLPWFGWREASINAWDSNFFGWGGTVLVIAGVVLLALKVFEIQDVKAGNLAAEQIALLAVGLGAIFILVPFLFGFDVLGVSFPRKFGIFLALIGAAGATYGTFSAMSDAGLEMPTADDFKSDDEG